MPIYVYRCPECATEREEIRRVSEIDEPAICEDGGHGKAGIGVGMFRVSTTASFGFKTAGGNFAMFSGAVGPVTKGSRRVPVISKGHGLGGHRKFDKSKVAANPVPEKP